MRVAKLSLKQESIAVTSAILAKLAEDAPVRQALPGGGRIRLDHRLPFICVCRPAATDREHALEKLLADEAASLILPTSPRGRRISVDLLQALGESLSAYFGSFLIIEVWEDNTGKGASEVASHSETNGLSVAIHVTKHHAPRRTVEAISKALQKLRIHHEPPSISVVPHDIPAPPGLRQLTPLAELKRSNSFWVGLAVTPIYRRTPSGPLVPRLLRSLGRGISKALKHGYFAFTHRRARVQPTHYNSLGAAAVGREVFSIDHQLAAIGRSFDVLLQATPINAEAAWHAFRRSKFQQAPVFFYRPLIIDPLLLKRRLFAIQVERVEDPTLAYLFRQKQDELDRQITLLTDVDSPRFLQESLQIYGGISDWLLHQAEEILKRLPTTGSDDGERGPVTAAEFSARAAIEFEYYRRQCPTFSASSIVRDDMFTGLMVSGDQLLIGGRLRVSRSRVEALLQHEVGTHLVTRFNGRQQPIKQLEVGLAGYDGLQEGLAVLAEFFAGGLSRLRLRILAARVVAARRMIEGARFIEVFRLLDGEYQFSQRAAYTIALRIYRGGGLTKDAVYLRGLLQILRYLREGGDLEPLYMGKMAAAHLPLVAELRLRRVLRPPALKPRYLDDPDSEEKITRLRNGLTVLQLLEK